MDRRLASLLQAQKIYPVPHHLSVCVIHFGWWWQAAVVPVVPFRHSLNFKRANAQNRIKCAKCRHQVGGPEHADPESGSNDVWLWQRCGNNAEMPGQQASLANSNLATGNLTIEPATKLGWQP